MTSSGRGSPTVHPAVPAGIGGVDDVFRRLAGRRYALLPLTGPSAVFTEVQGRGPGVSTTPAALAALISSIAAVGVLQPVLVEERPAPSSAGGAAGAADAGGAGPQRLLVAGEQRLRACRWGAVHDPANPHFAQLPAVVCEGPLTEEDRRIWQLIENVSREDLQPGELAAGLLLTRCTMLADQLTASGHPPPAAVLGVADPVARLRALYQLRAEAAPHLGAPWTRVLAGLGVQLSDRKARTVVAAFAALPRELSADLDAAKVSLATRTNLVQLGRGRRDAAAEMWAAVRAAGRLDLLPAAVDLAQRDPSLPAAAAVSAADRYRREADAARAAALRSPQPAPGPTSGSARAGQLAVTAAIRAVRALTAELRSGRRLPGYDAGSLRLLSAEIRQLLNPAAPPSLTASTASTALTAVEGAP